MGMKAKYTNPFYVPGKEILGFSYYALVLVPTGMKVKSAILFSMSLMILSRPLLKNIPELVRTLQIRDVKCFKYD